MNNTEHNFVSLAIRELRPDAFFGMSGNTYEDILWSDSSYSKPTKEEVEAVVSRLQAEYESKQYQRDRQQAYPSYADQFDLLYHGGYDAWKASIDEVKQRFPKPTE